MLKSIDSVFMMRTLQNSHQPQAPPLHCWQIFHDRAIFSSLERENNPMELNLANKMCAEAIQTLTYSYLLDVPIGTLP